MSYLGQATAFTDYFQTATTDESAGVDYQLVFDRLPTLIAMAFIARDVSLPMYKKARRAELDLGLTDKGDRDPNYSSPVTVADTLTHDKTIEFYTSHFPQDDFFGEEGSRYVKDAEVIAVQDEIDGTQNYSIGSGGYSYVNGIYVKDSLTKKYVHMTSLVYDPLQSVLFVAVRSRGAYRFEVGPNDEISHVRPIQVANLDVRTATKPPYILMDTMGLGEDPVLRRVLQKLGYKAEPQSGSGLKVAAAASEANVCGMFRSQRGNPDPWDIALASLLVTEGKLPEQSREDWTQDRGLATSISGKEILDENRNFYDGYAIGAPLAHAHIVAANNAIEKELTKLGRTQNEMTPKEWDDMAERIAKQILS